MSCNFGHFLQIEKIDVGINLSHFLQRDKILFFSNLGTQMAAHYKFKN